MDVERLEVKLRHLEEQFEALQCDYRSIKGSIEGITQSIGELRDFSGEILFLHLMHLARDDARDERIPAAIKKLKKAQNVARALGNEEQVRDLERQIQVLTAELDGAAGDVPTASDSPSGDDPSGYHHSGGPQGRLL